MLSEFITMHRDVIVDRTRERVRRRPWPSVSAQELEHGVPLFLTQLSETLRLEDSATPFSTDAIGASAARHGAEMLAAGFNVAQVVHDYGDICQTITDVAIDQRAPITVEEFHTLNRCLDTAIAEAVTEHARLTTTRTSEAEIEHLGQAAHELRDLLNGALLAFHALKRGAVAINGNTGAVLGRSLTDLRDLVDRTLSEVRLRAGKQRRERLNMTTFVDEIAATGILHAEYRGLQFTVVPADPALAVDADPQLLASAVMNLLHNAFKFSRAGGSVALRVHSEGTRVLLDIQDECGGIRESQADLFQAFGERRNQNRSGLGLGLSMARQTIRAHGGEIQVRNLPGCGCVFTIDLPLAAERVPEPVSC
jgi:signal transduction histidine kinase